MSNRKEIIALIERRIEELKEELKRNPIGKKEKQIKDSISHNEEILEAIVSKTPVWKHA